MVLCVCVGMPDLRNQYLCKYVYAWNPNDPCLNWKRPCCGGLKPQNKGQPGSRYTYIYIHMYCMEFEPLYEHIYRITVAWAIWMTLWGIGVFCLLGLYKAMRIGPFYTFGMRYRTYLASMLSMMYHCLHTRTFQKNPVIVDSYNSRKQSFILYKKQC